ncbi:MAG TPA: NRDE family protein [Puia sp.]
MCTVTFIPAGHHFFFTSSRDEMAGRPQAFLPEVYELNGYHLLFPKDPKGGGSWIAVNEQGHVAVLLNGAMNAHQPVASYRKSRGLILTDLISTESPAGAFEETDFNGIEPFTVILFENRNLYSGKWDGQMKWLESLNANKPHIWSSVTLYDPIAIRKREEWFLEWLSHSIYPGSLDIIHFHQKGGDGDPFNDILMNRDHKLFTNSISSIRHSTESASFRYLDLRNGETSESILPLQKTVQVKV